MKTERKQRSEEWKEIVDKYPAFARAILIQQGILMEASQTGLQTVDRAMCKLVATGLPVLFEDYWRSRCPQVLPGHVEIGGLIGCLSETNRDPARCFGGDEEDWFDDPLAGGQVLPPKPPGPLSG